MSAHTSVLVDHRDVPAVSVRELALAIKLMQAEGLDLANADSLTESVIRRVEQAFWQGLKRDRRRKVAALLRFRCLVDVARTRRMAALLASHGKDAVFHALAAAASLRLNTTWGFSPQRIATAILEGIRSESREPLIA